MSSVRPSIRPAGDHEGDQPQPPIEIGLHSRRKGKVNKTENERNNTEPEQTQQTEESTASSSLSSVVASSSPTRPSRPSSRASSWPRPLTIDLRAIAIWRIFIGVLFVSDITQRWSEFSIFYSPTAPGVLPAADVARQPGQWSLLFAIADLPFAVVIGHLLMLTGLLAGRFMAFGFYSRISASLAYLMMISIQNRQPDVLNKGDMLARTLMMWSLLMPLGSRWSIDWVRTKVVDSRSAAHATEKGGNTYFSAATVGYIIQVAFIYLFNALSKLQSPSWSSTGDAVFTALHGRDVLTRLGVTLGESLDPATLRLITFATVGLELIGPILLFVLRGRWRIALVSSFALLHIGIALCMRLGQFPYQCLVMLIPLLPTEVWDLFEAFIHWNHRRWKASGSPKWHYWTLLYRIKSSSEPAIRLNWDIRPHRLTQLVACALLVWVTAYNLGGYAPIASRVPLLGSVVTSGFGSGLARATGVRQEWSMYAPTPYKTTTWLVTQTTLPNHDTPIDMRLSLESYNRLVPVSWSTPVWPDLIADRYPSARWLKYLQGLRTPVKRAAYARWLCSEWVGALDRGDSSWRPLAESYLPFFPRQTNFANLRSSIDHHPIEVELYYLQLETKTPGTPQQAEPQRKFIGKFKC